MNYPRQPISNNQCQIAEDLGKSVLTLPTYYGLTPEDATEIAEMIKEIVK